MIQVLKRTSLKILVVDDEILIAGALQRTLMDLGNEVPEVACTVEDALEKVARLRPDLIFMDIRLASGMDGIAVAAIIKERFGTPVVFLIASTDQESLACAAEIAPYGYLVKPVLERDIRIITNVAMGRHAAEVLLRESENRNRMILEISCDAFIAMDNNGLITDWNPQAELVFGWSRQEALGRTFGKTAVPVRLRKEYADGFASFLGGSDWPALNHRGEITLLHRDGHEFPAELVFSSIPFGEKLFYWAHVRDLSEQKRAACEIRESRYALEQAQKDLELKVRDRTIQLEEANFNLAHSNAEFQQFAYIASHDLQEPLRMVITYLQFLERRNLEKLDSDDRQFIDFAVGGAVRMQSLIQDLLAFAQIGKKREKAILVDFNVVFENVKKNLMACIEESKVRIDVSRMPTLVADPLQMVQLFQNLVSNAIKYRSERPPEIEIGVEEGDEEWVFSVRDNGIGINPEYQHKIFEIFQRLHSDRERYPGTGIGLSICKKIAECHCGRVWVESRPGEGSHFFFALPQGVRNLASDQTGFSN